MKKKLTRTGNSVALVLDRPLLEQLGMDEGSEVEVSSNGCELRARSLVGGQAHEE